MNSLRGILGAIRQADNKFDFFHEKDKIMLGISGGKDSMVLALTLSRYKSFNCVNFEIVSVMLDLGFPNFDPTPIKNYLESIGLSLIIVDSKEVYQILKTQQKNAKNLPCSICSRMKKAAINKVANELGCNKVAFAHHGDDALETLLMNEIFGGRIATFQPKMYLDKSKIEFIRPLILVHEKEIVKCIKEENIPFIPSNCPNDGMTMRKEMKDLLTNIYEKYPMAKKNFFSMLQNYEKEQLFYSDFYFKVERKDLSFKPVILAKDSLLEAKIRYSLNTPNFLDVSHFLIYRKNKIIGVTSLDIKDEELTIIDLELIKENLKTRLILLNEIERHFSHYKSPLTIYIKTSKYDDCYISHGYKKARKNGLFKIIS